MRSHSFLPKLHLLLKPSAIFHPSQPFLQSGPRSLRYKRIRTIPKNLSTTRYLSSSAQPPTEPEENPASDPPLQPLNDVVLDPGPNTEEPEKATPKPRRTRINSSSNSKDGEALEFPPGLEDDVLYLPTESLFAAQTNGGLPPAEIFEEALDNLLITLHPQNQHRAMHPSGSSSRAVEPTLALYCPIEGGDYVIDVTIQELAYQTGAEVLVLDSVQLAAGEWGPFGKAANSLDLPHNPLHFSAPPTNMLQSRPGSSVEEQQEDEGAPVLFATPSRMSVTFNRAFPSIQQNRGLVTPNTRKPASPTKLDTFFDTLVNLCFPEEVKVGEIASTSVRNRPRLIYIRDFPTLAPSSSTWYPALLTAVRQRRRRLLSRVSNATSSPVTIIFGMTPPITPPSPESSAASSSSSFMNLLMSRNSSGSQMAFGAKPEQILDWSETEVAEAARERRLRSRLKKWERNATALFDEFPPLPSPQDGESSRSNIILIGGGSDSPMPLPPILGMPLGLDATSDSAGDTSSQFFRSSVLVPGSRSINLERETRIERRREINELTMRMGVGAVGGLIDPKPASSEFSLPKPQLDQPASDAPSMTSDSIWEEWGNKVEVWSNVRKIADRAMGSMMVLQLLNNQEKAALAPTIVPWSAVQTAWGSSRSLSNTRKNWLKETMGAPPLTSTEAEGNEKLMNAGSEADKVVESIKNDPDLEQHEARLLPCIVDSLAIKTTFNQVHLPSHTIDSIRTIVSLPLLHPHAFQQGILKEHSMTGCLLFGPPGTGKTLAVRALAKEAGCRMLAISPSDVMDMYVGEGEKLVRAVFSLARRLSPCVVFLDEIDALFGARMSARDSGSAFAHRGVITEFMQEMDGLKSSKDDNVIVIGATNRPFDLDDAVLRRLPRRLLVDLPGETERKEILKILLRDEVLASDVAADVLAKRTDGFSGSDLKHLCVSAALDSVKEHMKLPWASRHDAVPVMSLSTSTPTAPNTLASPNDLPQRVLQQEPVETTLLPHTSTVPAAQSDPSKASDAPERSRVLHLRHFTQALKEITPSSSESLGSLADLRKWNDEFGEGRKDHKKRQVWGKGRFGFVDSPQNTLEEGRVAKE
ncbi:hypothetical protein GALMADRAFT_239539 [Galerina marginata CBS 339.88]|uniref:AAA+ ATPase domain-containing protein n=1 Tax=Galerina marginata (strain CBS 339.88) TaxID=685588 RepID=A0A067TEH6_GALM3|nr:hypothetical protein GALMADRAFT_239539 [Galerina marginata CBS 339.88]